jgi:PKD repeat protein
MNARLAAAPQRIVAGVVSLLLVFGVLGVLAPGAARADSAPSDPANPATPPTVTADALPTVQVDGVVWSQVVVGNTVYVAGRFTKARPAGVPAGTSETQRNNMLAYDIRTGELITSFAPNLNATALTVAASPDGSRIYVGGDFTKANGQVRNRVAAYDTATGRLVPEFAPNVTGQVRAIAATDSTVYLGGYFTAVGSVARNALAAVSAADGSLRDWAPVPGVGSASGNSDGNRATSNGVLALVVTNGGSQVVAGGRFDSLNGVKATGVGALDAVTGQTRPFAINQLLTNQGVNSGVWSLTTDGTDVFGSAYDFYGPGNLEGSFRVAADGGAVLAVNDCRGDTYSTFPRGGVVYVAGHPHACSNIGGFPEQQPKRVHKFGTALSAAPVGVVGQSTIKNGNFRGQPAHSLLPWFPTFEAGFVTGQYQAGWSVTGNDQYVVYGGEFPEVNGVAQQGLVRFAVPSLAPNTRGPAKDLTATATSFAPGVVRVGWRATHDQDNENLVYRVYRDSATNLVHETTIPSTWWKRPAGGFTDVGVTAGSHRYRVSVSDPFGNTVTSGWTTIEMADDAGADLRPYAVRTWMDGAQHHWPLGEPSGSTAVDQVGDADMTAGFLVTKGQAGAVAGDPDTSYRFYGSNMGTLATQTTVPGPNVFSVEAWFQTTSTAGGKIVGFGDRRTGNSSNYDRHVYIDADGRLTFGVYPGAMATLRSGSSVEDGKWHHVVASLGPDGMALYLDGSLVGSRSDVTFGQAYAGYWRVGGDTSWSGSNYFSGLVDEVAVYPSALSAYEVAAHHAVGTGAPLPNRPPTARFTHTEDVLTVAVDGSGSTDPDGSALTYAWNFGDGSTATGATASHTYADGGTFPVTLTVTDAAGAAATSTQSVTVVAPPPNQAPTASFSHSVDDLAVAVDGSASVDPEGAALEYAWDFGDGGTATGATASHSFGAAGTYPVTLTVTDAAGATATATESVTVTEPAPDPEPVAPLAADAFARAVASGWGTADTGGNWTVVGAGSSSSVSDGVGRLEVGRAGGSVTALLNEVQLRDVALQAAVSLEAAPTGGGTYVYLSSRWANNNRYRVALKFGADGRVNLTINRVVAGVESTLRSVPLTGLVYTPGTVLNVRFDVAGEGTTTLSAKAWVQGTDEPEEWQNTATDSTAVLQTAGSVGTVVYVSGSATAIPVRATVDNWWTGPAGTAPVPAP